MNSFTRILKNFPLLLSIFSFVGICISYLNLFTYYNRFGINISEYISLSEVIILSLPDLILIGLSAILHYLFINSLMKSVVKNNWRLDFYISMLIFLSALILTIVLAIFNKLWLTHSFIGRYFSSNIFTALFAMIFYLAFLGTKGGVTYLQKTKTVNLQIISFSIVLISILILILVNNCLSPTTYLVRNKNVQLSFQNKTTFKSTDSCWLLGRTEKYYFIYDMVNKKTIIRPITDITQVTLDWQYFQ